MPALVRHHMAAAAMAMADIPMVDMLMVDRAITDSIKGIIPAMGLPTTIPPISTRRLISAPIIAGC
ncbi:hypothetical protein RvVAT039_22690 [Agrobacterium vitis]|nr:hypothetical protein RvVAT039_22690 [Agrobacterium vitis]